MKKQFITLATVVTTVVLISCSKGNLGQQNNPEEIATSANAEKGSGSSFNAGRKLEFWFPFNGNINDANGQVSAVLENGNTSVYTVDRFGTVNSAIKFDGIYRIALGSLRIATNMSVSVWVRYESATGSGLVYQSPLSLIQSNDKFGASITTTSTQGVQSNTLNGDWHHIVATYDGSYIKLYVDGNFVSEQLNQGSFSGGSQDYMSWIADGWQGSMDDLRFYTRTLSASDVQALYHLQ
jgi:hypothetical protein